VVSRNKNSPDGWQLRFLFRHFNFSPISMTSLQLGYRFYEINYKNGTGNNAFGFEQNFNGPFIAATFYF